MPTHWLVLGGSIGLCVLTFLFYIFRKPAYQPSDNSRFLNKKAVKTQKTPPPTPAPRLSRRHGLSRRSEEHENFPIEDEEGHIISKDRRHTVDRRHHF